MNGVSHMLVFVVAGGVLTAVSFLWGIMSFDSTNVQYNTFAAMLKIIGGIAMNLMVPVLSAYIAESIGKRPALVPGFVAGMIAITGLPVSPETGLIDAGGSGVGFGFLGGIVGGFLSGYVILLLEKVFAKLPQNLNGLKAMFPVPAVLHVHRGYGYARHLWSHGCHQHCHDGLPQGPLGLRPHCLGPGHWLHVRL